METNIKRLVIYPTDMMRLTGKCERTVRKWIAAIKKKHHKERDSMITIDEFCSFTGIKPERVLTYLE